MSEIASSQTRSGVVDDMDWMDGVDEMDCPEFMSTSSMLSMLSTSSIVLHRTIRITPCST